MKRVPKLCESWTKDNTTIEVYEDIRTVSSCDLTYYKLRIIVDDSKQFPVLSGAINEAKRILQRKNHRELREIGTDFDLSGKE